MATSLAFSETAASFSFGFSTPILAKIDTKYDKSDFGNFGLEGTFRFDFNQKDFWYVSLDATVGGMFNCSEMPVVGSFNVGFGFYVVNTKRFQLTTGVSAGYYQQTTAGNFTETCTKNNLKGKECIEGAKWNELILKDGTSISVLDEDNPARWGDETETYSDSIDLSHSTSMSAFTLGIECIGKFNFNKSLSLNAGCKVQYLIGSIRKRYEVENSIPYGTAPNTASKGDTVQDHLTKDKKNDCYKVQGLVVTPTISIVYNF